MHCNCRENYTCIMHTMENASNPEFKKLKADNITLRRRLARLVEAAFKQSITAKYLCLDLKGHGLALSEQLEKETFEMCEAIADAKEA